MSVCRIIELVLNIFTEVAIYQLLSIVSLHHITFDTITFGMQETTRDFATFSSCGHSKTDGKSSDQLRQLRSYS